MSLEDTVVSSTASDPDMEVFEQQRPTTVATSTGPHEDEDEDEVSEARSAPPIIQHDRGDISEEDVDTMENGEAASEVGRLPLLLTPSIKSKGAGPILQVT
jgi:hypothetical protein